MKKIALIGECMIKLNGEPFGIMQQTYGGDSLNTATYLARTSLPEKIQVYYVSALGADKISQKMIELWEDDGINTKWVLKDPHHQLGLYLIQLDQQGERTFLYWRNQSAARYLLQHPDYPKVLNNLSQVDAIYLSGISLAILPPDDRTTLIKQLTEFKKQGITIIFDSNYRPALWNSVEETQHYYAQLLSLVDVALVTFDDEQLLWQDLNEQQCLQRLSSKGIQTIVLKQGKSGVILQEICKIQPIPTIPINNVIDTTSAGDAFNAGFLNGYLQDKDLTTCCQQGNQLAGVVIQHKGAIIPKSATQNLINEFN
ncbi:MULTISPECIES: sugar kinase [Pasteurellaceae]|uniref:2-dehydro-3-deoxygluconokinase n=1 Tax=Pasteurella atlantica TaxID=2827233 RepID=A0AAW8CM80_9PAST|nr:sugar kinase [Pasteurella atlantica]MBR0573083.1 sugar kinase [Pasteurella atlantica]MDP8039060.1 sugar kinase [Pasteurella atlantica]MDP8041150.1 sugar kinase [Pasteurella atlantica]MDP8043237.1 sugar kinase [Pasteurella atlantica]MDP8045323.1 sugar kinase [Pasteurella atlantica]